MMIFDIFNPWKEFPKNKPECSGKYLCTCLLPLYSSKYDIEYQPYVLELTWDREVGWKDDRKLSMLSLYDVKDFGGSKINPYVDTQFIHKDVVAFKRLPKPFIPKRFRS